MHIPAKQIENFYKIGLICALWIIWMLFYNLFIYFAVNEVEAGKMDFVESIATGFVLGLLFGLINGFLEVSVFKQGFRRMKFGYTVIVKTVLFAATFIVTVILFILIKSTLLTPLGISPKAEENEIAIFFHSTVVYKHGLYAVLFSFVINFLLQIDKKMGRHVLFNLFIGRFHRPRRQQRIIMFLDLRSSTTIAEKLGADTYSSFLRDFFYDLDEAIGATMGAVYQYVGDEAVVVWDVKDGVENNNCVRCYYEANTIINKRKDRYTSLYGVSPQFKAGIHLGEVIITEVGGTKSEIAYHGDTMNTTSRLCAAARDDHNGLLISAELLRHLPDIDGSYNVESVGAIHLRGREHDIEAFTVAAKT